MEYLQCDWTKKDQVAELYGLTVATVRNWEKRGDVVPPWRDPWKLLDWYRVTVRREPKAALQARVRELGAEIVALGDYDDIVAGSVPLEVAFDLAAGKGGDGGKWENRKGCKPTTQPSAGPPAAPASDGDELSDLMKRVCGDVGLGLTLARVVTEERKAFETFEENRADPGARKDWLECVRVKREYSKTPDAVQAALELLKFWVRGEWEARWKELRQRLGGRMMGLDIREALMEAGDDEVEWRRLWDMEMERVICEWEEGAAELNG